MSQFQRPAPASGSKKNIFSASKHNSRNQRSAKRDGGKTRGREAWLSSSCRVHDNGHCRTAPVQGIRNCPFWGLRA